MINYGFLIAKDIVLAAKNDRPISFDYSAYKATNWTDGMSLVLELAAMSCLRK